MTRIAWLNRRNLVLALLAALVAAGLALGFREPAPLVDAAEVVRGPFRVTIEEEGRTRVKDRYEVSAPIAGQIARVLLEPGDRVSPGAPILTLGDLDSLEVEVDVLSPDAVRLQPGMTVELERWGGDTTLPGRVRRIEPSGFTKVSALGVEEQRVWVYVEPDGDRDAWRRLGDGYRVEARFVVWQGDDVLQVPAGALFREVERWGLYVIDGDRVRHRPVTPGRRGGLLVQVLDGLQAGERVVLHPGQDLRDGARGRVR